MEHSSGVVSWEKIKEAQDRLRSHNITPEKFKQEYITPIIVDDTEFNTSNKSSKYWQEYHLPQEKSMSQKFLPFATTCPPPEKLWEAIKVLNVPHIAGYSPFHVEFAFYVYLIRQTRDTFKQVKAFIQTYIDNQYRNTVVFDTAVQSVLDTFDIYHFTYKESIVPTILDNWYIPVGLPHSMEHLYFFIKELMTNTNTGIDQIKTLLHIDTDHTHYDHDEEYRDTITHWKIDNILPDVLLKHTVVDPYVSRIGVASKEELSTHLRDMFHKHLQEYEHKIIGSPIPRQQYILAKVTTDTTIRWMGSS